MKFLTENEQTELYLKLRDLVFSMDETSFSHWSDGHVVVEARESFNGSIAVQFLPFLAMPPEHWVDRAFHKRTDPGWVDFKHNREDRR
jgi:hypothetical protein